MKPCLAFLPLLLYPLPALSEPYAILGFDGVTGQDQTSDSSSLMLKMGIGVDTRLGLFAEWEAAINMEKLLFENRSTNANQHVSQTSVLAGYKIEVLKDIVVAASAGSQAGFFDEQCYIDYGFSGSALTCLRTREYGPVYSAGVFSEGERGALLGIEYRRYELSPLRKYEGISLSVRGRF